MDSYNTDVDGTQKFEPWPESQIHVEWGVSGATLAAERRDLIVLVDILSFSTSVSVACGRGATVFVYSLEELDLMGGRETAAKGIAAEVVTKSRHALPGQYSLSPASLIHCTADTRLIVTSLNGAKCVSAASAGGCCFIGSFRNRSATADYVARLIQNNSSKYKRVTIVSCGEQWPSFSGHAGWRPCLEDWLGAGAIAESLVELGLSPSVETESAIASYIASSSRILEVLRSCVSGRELCTKSFTVDVKLAAEIDVESAAVVETDKGKREFKGQQLGDLTPFASCE